MLLVRGNATLLLLRLSLCCSVGMLHPDALAQLVLQPVLLVRASVFLGCCLSFPSGSCCFGGLPVQQSRIARGAGTGLQINGRVLRVFLFLCAGSSCNVGSFLWLMILPHDNRYIYICMHTHLVHLYMSTACANCAPTSARPGGLPLHCTAA